MPRAARFRPIELETDRFRLIPIRPLSQVLPTLHWTGDRDAFANLGWRTTGWTRRRWWRHLRHQTRRGRMCHGIWPKAGGPCIGLHIVNVSGFGSASVAILIGDKDWWGKGVVAEVREVVLADCFDRLKMERIAAYANVRNLASVYNHRKLGFVHEGTLRLAAIDSDGAREDVLVFGMLRAEWLARRRDGGGNDG